MQNMLAYTIESSVYPSTPPQIVVGQGSTRSQIKPSAPRDNSYWFVFLDANNPRNKVQDFMVPGGNNTAVPAGVDQYMTNPALIFAVVTQWINTLTLPQGDLYDYLVSHGAGRELQKLEQIFTTVSCGMFGPLSYILTGQGGPANSRTPAYEASAATNPAALLMSLMPQSNGNPPYSICNSYTFITRAQAMTA